MPAPTPAELLKAVEYQLLRPTLTDAQLAAGCDLARANGLAAVCIKPYAVPLAATRLLGSAVAVIARIGLVDGDQPTAVKVFEAERAVADGAAEVEVSVNTGKLFGDDWGFLADDIRAVAEAARRGGGRVRVAFENKLLNDAHKRELGRVCGEVGVDAVKIATAAGPAGLSDGDIAHFRKLLPAGVGLAAAGGIERHDRVLAVLAAGAGRVGVVDVPRLLAELQGRPGGAPAADEQMFDLFASTLPVMVDPAPQAKVAVRNPAPAARPAAPAKPPAKPAPAGKPPAAPPRPFPPSTCPGLPPVAVYYQADGYDTQAKKIMGRRAAGESFLTALAPSVDELICLTDTAAAYEDFRKRVPGWAGRAVPTRCVTPSHHAGMAAVGTVYYPGPTITPFAWDRRRHDQRGFSLCGVFHTTASARAMDEICQYHVAPLQSWDAVICTSHAMKAMVLRQLAVFAEYQAARHGVRPACPAQLPVIPLGVHAGQFDPPADTRARLRAGWRQRLGVGPDDLCVLYVGRLSFHAKAHPLPMYLGLSRAAARVPRKVHLLQVGWFANPATEQSFRDGARQFCPNVTHHFLDGNDPNVRRDIWFAGDLFTSLSDNIQETFGLVPVEAMAAGLPVVASDWDGYRDTVRDGVDGFLVPTWQPAAGHGQMFAAAHGVGVIDYDQYLSCTNQTSVVEVDGTAEAYRRLLADDGLRAAMGAEGKRRAREVFDWSAVLAQYRGLWADLADRRKGADETAPVPPGGAGDPRRDDPFALFAAYPTRPIGAETRVALRPAAGADALKKYLSTTLTRFIPTDPNRDRVAAELFRRLQEVGPATVERLVAAADSVTLDYAVQVVGWLAKCDLVALADPADEVRLTPAG